ncbi:MAG: hypothetical protein IKA20_00460 [Clostridia bacterium]|nr:hypothetical protein [Clostridia bacterium]
MKAIKLDGNCKLYMYKAGEAPMYPQDIVGESIPSHIPGNVEIDLMNAGILPNIYQATNVESTRELELCDWWYVKDFEVSELPENSDIFLVFDGVDTYAEYFLNDVKIGESDNMLISHEFSVDGVVKQGKNQLTVHIYSSRKKAENHEINPLMVADWECFENLRCRKPAHAYGWDIFPRVVSAGIWRSVKLEFRPKIRIENVYVSTVFAREDLAGLSFHYELKAPAEKFGKLRVEFAGSCKDRNFRFSYPVSYKAATKFPYVENPLLWWPNGMGEANLYDVKVALYDEANALLDERKLAFGIRHVRLERADFIGENGFRLYVNEQAVMCKGANWVPLDVLHSKDAAKYEECVLNYVENNSNMVRVWGGGVYEDEVFFDLCDRYGIMVWQDMMLACHAYPQDRAFSEVFAKEVTSFIKRVRNHSSIVLYCGSNETDWVYFCTGQDPNDDVLTRKVIPEAIRLNDPYRLYYPSTPMFTREYVKQRGGRFLVDLKEIEASRTELPEEHYWWHRDDYETYSKMKHCFVGEIGYSGCLSLESMKECMDVRALTKENEYSGDAWKCHDYSTDGDVRHATKYYFGELPESLEDFVLSSQISQAEAYKYVVEQTRLQRPYMTGVLLWNMRDGWPAYNSAMIDYYGRKKLSYYYVKQSQQPLVFLMDDGLVGYACNDTLQETKGTYRIYSGTGALLSEGEFSVRGNQNGKIGDFSDLRDEKYLILVLQVGEKVYTNHFINEKRIHSFESYKQFLSVYTAKFGLAFKE